MNKSSKEASDDAVVIENFDESCLEKPTSHFHLNAIIFMEKEETARANIVKKQRNKNTSSQKTLFSFLETVKRP